jgi:hypothetical protein
MSQENIAKLHKAFDRLNSDLPLFLMIALADKMQVTPEEIAAQYEAWQTA